eukprot:CAMPEP_0114545836 /NCGR_PEP_ID=MMETSP0114-20121206/3622_1 /TAXON_ID=31324 /ORGANISM="Goniomonas sp, Strain m" /LENGTH=115 /DNA_ID=CAMNT_0001730309 /DNA_START=33 /DNA_END=380 /DNA_ORIENTATION=+
MKDIRITFRRRHAYNTRANKTRLVKTPGGVVHCQYIKKKGSAPRCGDCRVKIQGVPSLRPREYSRVSRRQKTVTRAYGGSRCAQCVRQRVIRAFLIEEQKNVKLVLQAQQKKQKK